jgi:pimeloyl-ACP methyl ester carboxylesterase
MTQRPSLHVAALTGLFVLAACGAHDSHEEEPVTYGEAISADGVRISYEVRGTAEPTLILIHGWTNSRGIWGVHPRTLSDTHRVVALDLAGHGVSGDDRTEWTIDAFGDDVGAVADDLGLEEVVLVGFSMGVPVALEAAERLGDRVLGVIVVDGLKDLTFYPTLDSAEHEQAKAFVRAAWGNTDAIRSSVFAPDVPDSIVQYVASMMPAEPREHWFDVAWATEEWLISQRNSTLRGLAVPVAAINTAEPPTNVELTRQYAPSFTVDTMEGLGHAGLLLRRTEDFDARLLAIVDRFASAGVAAPEGSP